ncbi:hypothetical protein RI578_06600 [Streptomyces sp. BB1-1-1]|uniref:hypothetical protein n=1 Tax=Streptomyces sp. BB1-1-1 TaxID=3074430 RepID=UPI002877EA27|nr:hypothetical protein [Streptomyces sp. BB1-1-1]WND33983.1 hypothetical protein RI578_06600 [Streptomyces sp. BB1-1-1]
MATGPDHYREAERLQQQADTWENADTGWKAHLSTDERLARRNADLLAGLVHAVLANAAATALNDHATDGGGMPLEDYNAWVDAAAVWKPKRRGGETP